MTFSKTNSCIIFGSSPFINEFGADNINYLISKYTTFGINCFPLSYPNTTYWIWSDFGIYYNIKHLISNYKIITSKEVCDKEICGDFNPEYVYDGVSDIQFEFNNKLAIFKTSAHPAINYAMLLGFKNIILCGIDLTKDWKHFYNHGEIIRTDKRIKLIRNKLYEFKNHVNLYQLNPNSDLNIEKINIENL